MNTTGNTAFSIYNALQTSFTVHNLHNWTVLSPIPTAVRSITLEISPGGGGTTVAYAQNPLDTNVAERGVSGNSYPNVIGLQMNYSEPWFKGQNGWLGRLLGGYSFNAFYTYNNGQPYNPYQFTSAQSPFVNQADPLASTSFCDFGFSQVFIGIDACRPILSNSRAPLGSVGVNTGAGGYINYATGQPIAPSSVHWLWNNQYEAMPAATRSPALPVISFVATALITLTSAS